MIQLPFYLGLFALGACFNLAVGPRRDGALVAVLAFPCGLAVWVLAGVIALAIGVPLGPLIGISSLLAGTAAFGWAALRRGRPTPEVWRPLAMWAALFAVSTAVLCSFSAAKFSGDSHQILRLAHLLGRGAPLEPTVAGYLSDRGIFTIISYSAADVIGASLLYSLAPVLGLSLAALFAVCADRMAQRVGADPRPTRILIALAVVALITTFNPSYHLFYIHMNQGSAIYLLGFAALAWLADSSDDPAFLPPAFLCLAAFSLHRVEAPVFAGLFAVFAFYPGGPSRRALAPWFAGYTIFVAAWMIRFGSVAPADSEFLSAGRAAMLAGAIAACFAGWFLLTTAPFRRLRRLVPVVVAALMAVALVAAFELKPEHMTRSYDALAENVGGLRSGAWGITWWVVALVSALALLAPPLPAGRALFLAVPVAAALTMLLAYGRIPYRIGLGDSANRMFLHYLPIAMLYPLVKLAPRISERR